MREQKSLDFSGARATTPCSFQVVAFHWKAAVEGGTAHLTILTCRWLASSGCQVCPLTVLFSGATPEKPAYHCGQPAIFTFAFPHGKRSGMATVHALPSTHIAGLIRVQVVTRPLTVPF